MPISLSPNPNMDYKAPQSHVDEEEVSSRLLRPLERFIFAAGDPACAMEELCKLEDPPAQCGRVFGMGEPTYTCRDCALDPTVVMCLDCFNSSEHKRHRYKMSTSYGGGYCDCGDVEAFSSHPHCSVHARGLAGRKEGDAGAGEGAGLLNKVPADIQVAQGE